jgi:hypothetical protein
MSVSSYAKTQGAMEKAGLKYNKPAPQLNLEKWFESVTNP